MLDQSRSSQACSSGEKRAGQTPRSGDRHFRIAESGQEQSGAMRPYARLRWAGRASLGCVACREKSHTRGIFALQRLVVLFLPRRHRRLEFHRLLRTGARVGPVNRSRLAGRVVKPVVVKPAAFVVQPLQATSRAAPMLPSCRSLQCPHLADTARRPNDSPPESTRATCRRSPTFLHPYTVQPVTGSAWKPEIQRQ